jgi:hypothetical protein
MARTFTVCSWSLVALGFGVTTWLYPYAVGFVPYLLLAFATMSAHRLGSRAAVLLLTLGSVCASFWYFWDAAFIRLSTLNLMPFDVAVVESLVTGAAWFAIRRSERVKHEASAA